MPNAYLTLAELRETALDGQSRATFKYDHRALFLLGEVSRWVDDYCHRVFYPYLETRYFDGSGTPWLKIPDLISITSVSYSEDDGVTYTALTGPDYIGMVQDDYNSRQSYNVLKINVNSTVLSTWPCGQRSIKIVGVWGYTDDRNTCFFQTGDTVQSNPFEVGDTTLSVVDVDGLDIYGGSERFSPGGIYRVGSEYIESTLVVENSTNYFGVLRGCNGTTEAEHAQHTIIYQWRAPDPIKEAVAIQCARLVGRGKAGFGDAAPTPEIGGMLYTKALDPDVRLKLNNFCLPRAY